MISTLPWPGESSAFSLVPPCNASTRCLVFWIKAGARNNGKRERPMRTCVQGSRGRGGHVSLSRYVHRVVHRVQSQPSPLYAPLPKTFYTLPALPFSVLSYGECYLYVCATLNWNWFSLDIKRCASFDYQLHRSRWIDIKIDNRGMIELRNQLWYCLVFILIG